MIFHCPEAGRDSLAGVGPHGGMRLSQSVVQTIQGACAPSTRKYYYRWELFVSWCRANHVDEQTCAALEVLWYLQGLLEAGKSPSTIRGMVAAIKAARVGGNRLSDS